jgi:hypothetical protein
MRVALLCALAATMVSTAVRAAEYKPADPRRPLCRIFAPIPMKTPRGTSREDVTFDDKHPLLVVHSVSDLGLARDNKGVLITLTPADAKKFAEITRKYNGRLLLLEAEGQILEAMHIIAPITDGIIGFKHPDQASAAAYLRRRFRIAEFK